MCTAGTADLPVAEEAAVTAELLGITEVVRLWDVGVAGIQRLLRNRETVNDCDVVIVAAGMVAAIACCSDSGSSVSATLLSPRSTCEMGLDPSRWDSIPRPRRVHGWTSEEAS